ncbi:MAG TPA: thrombospondin type 3 repeat-containing protein [Polyangiaceae bacterium]
MKSSRFAHLLLAALALALLVFVGRASAADAYATQPPYTLTLPASDLSYGTSADAFDSNITTSVDGFPLRGRFLAAVGRTIYLQKNFGADLWLPVATLGPEDTMDPCFIKISPNGKKIALGVGFYKPLMVFETALLSVSAPPNLRTAAGVKIWDENMYDGAWRGNRYLFINAASLTAGSQIYAIDTDGKTGTPIPILPDIPGASGGLAFDAAGDLVTGIGFGYGDAPTGQLKIWPASAIDAALAGNAINYFTTGNVLIEGALSAASLGFDASGNLFVGGGDAFGNSGHYGYAGLVSAAAVQRVLSGGAIADPAAAADYVKVQPDPCHNDDATNVWYAPSLGMLVVTANLASKPPDCAQFDVTHSGPDGQQFFSPNAPDTDGDGIPDGADNAYLTANPDQKDSDGDGWGDAVDCDTDNDGLFDRSDLSALMAAFGSASGDANFAAGYDFNHDRQIDFADFSAFKQRWGKTAVCE